ncbi:uncharacterized protein LOC111242336 [Vigna radiata var. radiata]|uniref:Uncharacterized protein LOC111242336 n=1 Tax=Vigna radiata var. radiata TaxID=3916 RepID=A0A3Q0FAE1_VIGRR|nr:uncharacterized protein LOC111242336 [Vigna radiata var. radiata]
MSQHQNQNQNLPVVPQSGAAVKPFSIRQYVHASRHRNISQNWPFEEKHLQLCLENDLKVEELLPPIEPGKTSHEKSLKDFSRMHSPSDDNNKETDSCNAEVPQDIDDQCNLKVMNHLISHEEGNHSNHKYKRRRRKGKCKKRSMVDILAVARHSTSEDIDEMNKFCHAETVTEGCQQAVPFQHNSMAEAMDEDSCRKVGSEDHHVM